MPSKPDLNNFRGEVGEMMVAYELMRRGLDVSRHLGGHGYDLFIHRGGMGQQTVEIKTTDARYKTGTAKKQLTAVLSPAEMGADWFIYLIHCDFDNKDTYFVIPKRAFPTSRSITVTIGKNGEPAHGSAYEPYRNNWTPFE